jgi:protein TorT
LRISTKFWEISALRVNLGGAGINGEQKVIKQLHSKLSLCALVFAGFGLIVFTPSEGVAAGSLKALEVDVWDPPFNTKLKRRTDTFKPLKKAKKQWRICTSIPHLKDPYWAAVNYGLIDEAKRLGVSMRLSEAGGYAHLDVQRQQIEECMASGGDALIVSSISADGLDDLIKRYTDDGKVVIDMINGTSSTDITARCGVDFWDTGNGVAQYLRNLEGDNLRNLEGDNSKDINVGWFPGPDGAAWVNQGDKGFRDGIKGSSIKIVATAKGDTGRATQSKLVAAALEQHKDLNYVIGTTVTANAAVDLIRGKNLKDKIKVLAYYYGPGVHRGIRRGSIVAAPTDLQSVQARMSVNLAVKAMEGLPFFKHIGPKVIVVDRKSVGKFDTSTSLPPRGFRPIFSVNDW